MKPGAECDPFDEESPGDENADGDDIREEGLAVTSDPDTGQKGSGYMSAQSTETQQEPPYVLRRSTAKEDRKMVQFFLREEFGDTGERRLKSRVEDILETEVSKLDLREAAYAFAQEHPEAVAELLRTWGYEYR